MAKSQEGESAGRRKAQTPWARGRGPAWGWVGARLAARAATPRRSVEEAGDWNRQPFRSARDGDGLSSQRTQSKRGRPEGEPSGVRRPRSLALALAVRGLGLKTERPRHADVAPDGMGEPDPAREQLVPREREQVALAANGVRGDAGRDDVPRLGGVEENRGDAARAPVTAPPHTPAHPRPPRPRPAPSCMVRAAGKPRLTFPPSIR